MALVPGWHSTLFAPFFVDGAIFSGFAMVIVLVLPMRHYFRLHPYIGDRHLDALAKLLLTTSLVLTYFYACDIFIAWYSGDHIERASLLWRATEDYAWALALQYFCNSVVPLALFRSRVRTSPVALFIVSVFVLIGMWLERFATRLPPMRTSPPASACEPCMWDHTRSSQRPASNSVTVWVHPTSRRRSSDSIGASNARSAAASGRRSS